MDYTIGGLARRCGVTVRTLHHYDQMGLLQPSGRTNAGYRHYTARDVHRLHLILAWRQLGLGLKDIAALLHGDAPALEAVLVQQLQAMKQEAAKVQRVISLIERLVPAAAGAGANTLTDQLLELMNAMQSLEQKFTADELATLHSIRDAMTPAQRDDVRGQLVALVAGFRDAQAAGVDAGDASLRDLVKRWQALGRPAAQHAGHAQLRAKAREAIDAMPAAQPPLGITPQLRAYIDAAVAAPRKA